MIVLDASSGAGSVVLVPMVVSARSVRMLRVAQ
jgi:hypothetical protein